MPREGVGGRGSISPPLREVLGRLAREKKENRETPLALALALVLARRTIRSSSLSITRHVRAISSGMNRKGRAGGVNERTEEGGRRKRQSMSGRGRGSGRGGRVVLEI